MTADPMDLIVGGKWRLHHRIGAGSFGEVYIAIDRITDEVVAVKLERINTKSPHLINESKIYRTLSISPNDEPVVGISKVHWYGSDGDYNCMTVDLLGPSLEKLFNFCSRRFSLKTVLMLADQMIQRIEYVHSRSFLHRDIKPDNFLMGRGTEANIVHVADFGLSKRYRNHDTHAHFPYRDSKAISGTFRYISINNHRGIEQSRRDDLEALGFVFIYFIRGSLPWQGLRAATKNEKLQKIFDSKSSIAVDELCKDYPKEFATYMRHCRVLYFTERPNYDSLREIFRTLYEREGYADDGIFDWTLMKKQEMGNTSGNSTRLPRQLQPHPSGDVLRSKFVPPTQESLDEQHMGAHAAGIGAEWDGVADVGNGGAAHQGASYVGVVSSAHDAAVVSMHV